jgi:hypothetical protein
MPSRSETMAPSSLVDRTVRWLSMAVVLLVPIRVLSHGFLPQDDALRHAAKAVSGRPWTEIVVLRPDMALDGYPGWHALLRGVHLLTGADAHALVLLSVVGLFFACALPPLVLLRRPESWLVALLLAGAIDPTMLWRLLLGRPLLVTGAALVLTLLLWRPLQEERRPWTAACAATLAFTLANWMHGSWYLLVLPLACVAAARQFRAALRLTACWAVGTLFGAVLTGQPLAFLWHTVKNAYLTTGGALSIPSMAVELRPAQSSPLVLLVVLGVLLWRHVRGGPRVSPLRQPAFVLAAAGWVLGSLAERFWIDVGWLALLVWLAEEVQDFLESRASVGNAGRLALVAAVGASTVLVLGADVQGRWDRPSDPQRQFLSAYLSTADPEQVGWLPDPGGIFYSSDMRLFFRTFYRNPTAPWRYILGFEAALMPPEDLAVYKAVFEHPGDGTPYQTWVRKMRPADRLFVVHTSDEPPPIPGLEWHQVLRGLWSGRLPRSRVED